jgi:hypothetical protein
MRSFMLAAILAGLSVPAWAGETAKDVNPDEIIQKFAAKEAEFARARENYTYRQTVKIQTLSDSGVVDGRYEIVEDIIFSPDGKRTEKVVRAPVSTLTRLMLTPEDLEDLRNVQPFVLTTKEIPLYDIRYLGPQKADEIPCYVFAVKPKKMEKGRRYFEGQIWVDDRDFQIVKTFGKAVGLLGRHEDQQFPKFETLREQIDSKYWFPVYTDADDTLHFQAGPIKMRMIVKYDDYKQFKSDVNIQFGDAVNDGSKDQKANPPSPPKP